MTGGSGFIGRHVIRALLERGFEPTVFTRRQLEIPGCGLFLGDILDKEACIEAVGRHEAVIHLAGVLGTQELSARPHDAIQNNISGALNIFEGIRLHRRRAMFLSVLNAQAKNPYAISKYAAEKFALMMNKEFATKIGILRAGNVYGPRQKNYPVKKFIPSFIEAAAQHRDITLYGGGNQVSDTVFVDDLARACTFMLTAPNVDFQDVYEIGSGKEIRVIDVAREIIEIIGSRSSMKSAPLRSGEDLSQPLVANLQKLTDLGFDTKNFTDLRSGLRVTIQQYLQDLRESGNSRPGVEASLS